MTLAVITVGHIIKSMIPEMVQGEIQDGSWDVRAPLVVNKRYERDGLRCKQAIQSSVT